MDTGRDDRAETAETKSRSWKKTNEATELSEMSCSARVRLKIPCDASILAALLALPCVLDIE